MFSKYIKILMILLLIKENISSLKITSKCIFQNKAYPFEYLYSSNESADQPFNYFNRKNVYTYPLAFMNDMKMISLELRPIIEQQNSTVG